MNNQSTKKDSGMVAIVVTVVIMLVITLIVITFARISRRNQRQSLDQQLHTQALYAAESGINDAIEALKADPTLEKTDCSSIAGYNNVLDGGASSYSCVLIDPTPLSVEFGNIGKGESKTVPIEREDGASISSLTIHWQDPNEDERLAGCPTNANARQFPSTWYTNCGPGILRIDLVKIGTGAFNRANSLTNTMTGFFAPVSTGASATTNFSTAAGFGNQGRVVPIRCVSTPPNSSTKPKHCSALINGLTGVNSQKYYMRITALYKAATVTICMPNCGTSSTLSFAKGSQAKIDSTGKVSDILRRIQVFVSTSELDGPFPGYAIESSETLCKRFSIAPPNTVDGDLTASDTDPNPTHACTVP